MSRRLRRDRSKRISSAGYHKFSGDLEVTGNIIGPSMANVVTAIDKLVCGTTTPVQLTISRCEGVYKGIILQWLIQYNLVNFDHYEIQVSADDTNWYSLEFDGTDWKDVFNADTDVVAPMIVHIPIPFGGTAENPTAVTLYYRMRQKTILGVASDWSVSASAATSLIQTGDLAANIVTANKILAGTITTTEIAAATILASNLAAEIITAREMAFSDDSYANDVAVPTGAELFDLSQPDCVSHSGRQPNSDKQITYLPPTFKDEVDTEYNNPWCKWTGRGVVGLFKATENLADSPEDYTTSDWANAHSTDVLSDFYFNGKRFTKITGDGLAIYARVRQIITFTGDGKKSISCIFKKGNGIKSRLFLYDNTVGTERLNVQITWSTKAVSTSIGTLEKANWYGDDIVEVFGISTTVTVANENKLYISPVALEAANTTNYAYATAVMPEDSIYPALYTPTSRPKANLQYPLSMLSKFTLIFWVRPWFTYDTSVFHRCMEWALDGTHRWLVYYYPTDDKIRILWQDGGTVRALASQVFDDGTSHDDINQWIMIGIGFDSTTGDTTGSILKVYADTQVKDATWSGNIDAKSSEFPIAYMGQNHVGADQADALMTDFLFVPDEVWTEAQLDAHYTANRPYYDPDEVTNKLQSVRINKAGLRMHNAGLTITDNKNRLIEVSNSVGLMARDAAGQIIHDIPDAPILKNHWYLGHDLWNDDLATYKLYDVTTFPLSAWTDVTCLLNNNTNVKKGIFKIYIYHNGTATTTPSSSIILRPKGASWTTNVDSNAPRSYFAIYPASATVNTISRMFMMECPIGDDNKIQFYSYCIPSNSSRRLTISQSGVGI